MGKTAGAVCGLKWTLGVEFEHLTLEVSDRNPRGNNMGSGVFESGIQRRD